MATLSHHPSIVTVFEADVAPDGRPYLVMEYCSRPGLGSAYRTERIGVAEVLRIGVRLASAVETAHRAGILHRDIKPANVLVTDFGWPALTDFGIADHDKLEHGRGRHVHPVVATGAHRRGPARGRALGRVLARRDRLLAAGRPVAVRGPRTGRNTAADLISRIARSKLSGTGRPDVPDSLQAALTRAMDRVPARRFRSALAFARALQSVEAQLNLPLTPLDLPDDTDGPLLPVAQGTRPGSLATDPGVNGQATRLRPVTNIGPDGSPSAGSPSAGAPPTGRTSIAVSPALIPSFAEGVPQSWLPPQTETEPVEEPRSPWHRVGAVVAGVVLVAAVGTGAALAFGSPAGPALGDPTPTPTVPMIVAVPAPTDVTGVVMGDDAVFTWVNPDPQEGDRYLWARVEMGGVGERQQVDESTVTVPATQDRVCIQVSLVRGDGRFSAEPAEGCAQR